MKKENDIVYNRGEESRSDNENNQVTIDDNPNVMKKSKLLKYINITGIGILIITLSFIYIFFSIKNKKRKSNEEVEINDSQPIKLETEYQFNIKVHDLKRIKIHQKYYEDIMIDNNITKIFLDRKTINYIYIISEAYPNEEEKNYYDKIYTGAISIISECVSRENETCIPKKIVDLMNADNNEIKNSKEINDLKDIPLPLCLFNITNNDIITSITCHKSISENKKKMIILDLYFFRPQTIKKLNKKESNIKINYTNLDNNKKIIREINEGICYSKNSYNSFCTTDINITIDSDSNVLEYDEVDYIIFQTNEHNSYKKNIITKLIDETSKITSFNYKTYEQSLNLLLSKLEQYFQTNILFSKADYNKVNIDSKEGIGNLNPKLQFRKLNKERKVISKEKNLFNYQSNDGIEINMDLIINSGLNTEYFETNYNLKIDDKKTNIVASKESSLNFNTIINQLITLSEAVNHLISELLQKTNNSLDNMTQEINETISNLNSLVKYKDFSEIFDSTLSLEGLNQLPNIIIEETTNLINKLTQLLNEIENDEMKSNINILYNNIYNFTNNSHNLIFYLFNNLKKLSESLNSKKSKLTEISTYYLNHTTNSYIGIIEETKNIFNNYYKLEYDLIKPQIDSLIKTFENNLIESLQKESKIIDNLYKNIKNKKFTIERANDEDYERILNNLYSIKNYIDGIINKIENKITKEMDIKDSGYFISNDEITSNNYTFYEIIENSSKIANTLDNDEYIDKKFDQIMINFRENYTNIIKKMNKQKEELFPLNEDVLKDNLFTTTEKKNIQNNISNYGVNILNKIINENDDYLNETKQIINSLNSNKKYLSDLSSDLTILFSENLEELANLYEKAFNSCLDKINNELHQNELLSNEYFNN